MTWAMIAHFSISTVNQKMMILAFKPLSLIFSSNLVSSQTFGQLRCSSVRSGGEMSRIRLTYTSRTGISNGVAICVGGG